MQRLLLGLCIAAAIHFYLTKLHKNNKRQLLIAPSKERVLIVGCSSGIGRHVALQYAARGAHLVLIARRKELLESLRDECVKIGATRATIVVGDCTDPQLTLLPADMEGVDTVIYCAGAISVRPFMDACGFIVRKLPNGQYQVEQQQQQQQQAKDGLESALERITNINYLAAVRLARRVLPVLIETSKAPNLILISSLAGRVGAPTRAMYAGSKHAVHGFFDSLRVEVEPFGVHVGIVCPGTVDTDLRQSAVDGQLGKQDQGVAGSTKGKLSPTVVASRIIAASDQREREVFVPALMGHLAIWAKLVAAPIVDWAAKKKYGQK
ncbi:hypothetical protein BX666DRAFT_1858170 [Dichotomocladium elegans]|nr:hypothetical protein BX666DRAFT_1858170 [Dichotomocladium elegans]